MQKIFHSAARRGHGDFGWLKSFHSFSFAHYYDKERMGFGLLRVLNDDLVAASKGFETHSHENMEIISIPLAGALAHKDSQGHERTISTGEVQIMSAGTGVSHSEFNASDSEAVNFLQIWIKPEKWDIEPRYDQQRFAFHEQKNQFHLIASPLGSDQPGVKINQQAYMALAHMEKDQTVNYMAKNPNNGLYLFVIEGQILACENTLQKRDALGLTQIDEIIAEAKQDSQLLVIEVPMARP